MGFPNVIVEMPKEEYRREVVAFAREAGRLFDGAEKTFTDEFDRQQ